MYQNMYFLDIGLYQFCVFISALNFINIFIAIVLYNYIFLADTIRYLSLHDNKYIRYFPGHTKK